MSTIKWKIIPILLITAYLLLGCIGCSSYSSEEKDATDLTGDTLKPTNIGEISFDISEIGNMPLMTEFYICPANGTIEIKYAEGAWSNLKVDLYDIEYEESIQTGEIESVGDKLVFSNLSGEKQYYFKIDGTRDSKGKKLVFYIEE